ILLHRVNQNSPVPSKNDIIFNEPVVFESRIVPVKIKNNQMFISGNYVITDNSPCPRTQTIVIKKMDFSQKITRNGRINLSQNERLDPAIQIRPQLSIAAFN